MIKLLMLREVFQDSNLLCNCRLILYIGVVQYIVEGVFASRVEYFETRCFKGIPVKVRMGAIHFVPTREEIVVQVFSFKVAQPLRFLLLFDVDGIPEESCGRSALKDRL